MNTKVLLPDNQQQILDLEKSKLEHLDEMERSMISWRASWREEFLEHYLRLGWCYAVFNKDKISSYFLAQPILFFGGHMQTLWMEHLSCSNEEEKEHLIDLAYRAAREKHLQKLLLNKEVVEEHNLQNHKLVQEKLEIFSISTTKMSD